MRVGEVPLMIAKAHPAVLRQLECLGRKNPLTSTIPPQHAYGQPEVVKALDHGPKVSRVASQVQLFITSPVSLGILILELERA